QCARGDISRGAGGGVGGVVRRVRAADGDAADTHGIGGADILVGKTRAAVTGAQIVARDAVVGKGHRRAGAPVISLVYAQGAHHQRARGDVGGGGGGGVEGVVAGVRSGNGDAADAHVLGRADVLVGKARARVAGAQAVTRQPIIRKCHGCVGRAVVHSVHARGAHHQRARGDVRRGAGSGIGRVVGRIGSSHGNAANAHGFGRTHVLVR